MIKVTASLGVAGVPALAATDASDLLRLADAALYQAKARGRNCVVLAQMDDRPTPHGANPEAAARAAQRWSATEGNADRETSAPLKGRPDSGATAARKESGPLAQTDDSAKTSEATDGEASPDAPK
jgi:hypothetical protein